MTTILNKERILEQAKSFVEDGKFDKAIIEYEKILMADPNDLRVKLRIAELYTKRKQINEAIKLYREVAESYAAEEFYLKAVTVLKNILRLNPTLVDINLMLAELYEKMELTQDAIRQYDIVATILDQKGERERSLEISKKIVDLTPSSIAARIKLAEMLQREGMAEESVDQYAIIAKMYETQNKKDHKLAEIYEKILAHRDNLDMLRSLCRIYEYLGEKKKVLKCIDQVKKIASEDIEFLEMQARIYASLNQLETSKSKYFALAEIQKEHGNIDQAINAYVEVLILMPQERDKIVKRAEEFGKKAVDKLLNLFEKRKQEQIKREKQDLDKKAGSHIEIEEDTKDPMQAEKEEKLQTPIKKEIKIKSTKTNFSAIHEAGSSFNLGKAYLEMGLTDESKAEFKKASKLYKDLLQKNPSHKEIFQNKINEINKLSKNEDDKKEQTRQFVIPKPEIVKKEDKEDKKETNSKKTTSKRKISFV